MRRSVFIFLIVSIMIALTVGVTSCGCSEDETSESTSSTEDIDLFSFGLDSEELSDLIYDLNLKKQNFDDLDKVIDDVKDIGDYIFSERVDGYTYNTTAYDSYALLMWDNNEYTDIAIALMDINGDEDGISAWNSEKELCITFGEYMDICLEADFPDIDYHAVSVLVDPDTNLALLVAYNGEIIYDVTEHY